MRRRLAAAAIVIAFGLGVFAVSSTDTDRLRHLAIPQLSTVPAVAAPAAHPLVEQLGVQPVRLASVGKRISAIAAAPDGTLWLGLFDGGVASLAPGEPHAREVPGLLGRERFVSAIQVRGDRVYAASFAGLLEIDARTGRRSRMWREGTAVDGLVARGNEMIAGGGRGAFVLGEPGTEPADVAVLGDDGAAVRITALSSSGSALWLGTPRGVYLSRGGKTRWLPLVFGSPGASTNVVTAIAASESGAVAGTDNGGLVWLDRDGGVRAAHFADARANEINPGASSVLDGCALFGTQGAGLLVAAADRFGAVTRVGPVTQISAVTALPDGRVIVGTSEGELLAMTLPPALCATPVAAR